MVGIPLTGNQRNPLTQLLLAQGFNSTPPRTPTETFGRIAAGFSGIFQEQQKQKALADALAGLTNPQTNQTAASPQATAQNLAGVANLDPGAIANFANPANRPQTAAQPPGISNLAQALLKSGNPGAAFNLIIQNRQNQQRFAREDQRDERRFNQQKEIVRLRSDLANKSRVRPASAATKYERALVNTDRLVKAGKLTQEQGETRKANLTTDFLGTKINKNAFKDEGSLRNQFVGLSKSFSKQRDAFGRVESAATLNTGAGDIALVFGFMKIIDPGSTIREGEFATVENTAGVDARIRNLFNRARKGTRLDQRQRQNLVNAAKRQFAKAQAQHKQRERVFRNLAVNNNLNPDNVVINLRKAGSKASSFKTKSGVNVEIVE